MPGLTIHCSNRLEVLLQTLAREIERPLDSVFSPEVVVTQSPGMARWIAMELAQIHRISANLAFPFPNAFLKMLCEKLSLASPLEDPFEPAVLTFRVMQKLPDCLDRKGYDVLRSYLGGDTRHIRLLQLSREIAHLYDQYLVFRPEIVLEWEHGSNEVPNGHSWQADLWREVVSGCENMHRISMHTGLIARLRNGPSAVEHLPERVSIFGVSYLPAFHLQILAALADTIPVDWYLLSPCRQYWGDVVTDRDIRRIKETYARKTGADTYLHLDKGNSLLASMGTQGRDFLNMIAELGCDIKEEYLPPERSSLLTSVQADILDMLDAPKTVANDRTVAGADGSIEIHACHSIMREIEVLHDNLLQMFHLDPQLHPRDILVMTPDIDAYAPFIQAVFERSIDGEPTIPFSLADRSFINQDRVSDAFFAVLDMADSRMEAEKVTGFLDRDIIRDTFNLSEQDVATIGEWVQDLNVRWGLDGADRQTHGLPYFEENSWKSGIDRLLLGYAMAERDGQMFHGILPFDDMEGDRARILGNFLEYVSCLMAVIEDLKKPKTLEGWATTTGKIIDRMFSTDAASEKEVLRLKALVADLKRVQLISKYDGALALDALVYLLRHAMQNVPFGSGFLSGSVTFCAMLPMRSIPFKVICLIGMHGNAFPREGGKPGFDMMASHPRRGDRSRRNDDKYLFLEALISARKKLYISFIGRDIQDNSPLAPSVLASELMDYLTAGYGVAVENIVREHPLQAFSQDYFRVTSDLFSYSQENFAAAMASHRPEAMPKVPPPPSLPVPGDTFKTMDADTLGLFFSNPVKFFMQKRIGLFLEPDDKSAEDREHFRLEGLGAYRAGLDSLNWVNKGRPLTDLKAVFKARGVLPPGQVGEHDYAGLAAEVREMMGRVGEWTSGEKPVMRGIDLHLENFRITGTLADDYGNGLVLVRFANFNAAELVRFWIRHLLLCAAEPEKKEWRSAYLSRNATIVIGAVDNTRELLAYLLRLYWEGLSLPLAFFPKSAYAYAHQRIVQAKPPGEALRAAAGVMRGNPYANIRGEGDEPYIRYYFDEGDPLGTDFERAALAVYQPLLAHLHKISHKSIARDVNVRTV